MDALGAQMIRAYLVMPGMAETLAGMAAGWLTGQGVTGIAIYHTSPPSHITPADIEIHDIAANARMIVGPVDQMIAKLVQDAVQTILASAEDGEDPGDALGR